MSKSRRFQGGRSYHVTHRCHDRAYLLKRGMDRRAYLNLLWHRWFVASQIDKRREKDIVESVEGGCAWA